MSDVVLRPRSATEIVDAAFQLYRRHAVPFITGFALLYVPWLVIAGLLGLKTITGVTNPTPATVPSASATLLMAVGGIVIYALAGGATNRLAAAAMFGQPLDVMGALRSVALRLGGLIGVALLYGIAVGFGMIFLIVPGFIIFARLFASKPVLLFENKGVTESLSRSWNLTKGSTGRILGTLLLIWLVIIAVTLAIVGLTNFIPSPAIKNLFGIAISVVIYPLIGIVETLVYYDLRIRREAFDLEYLAASAPAEHPSGAPGPV